MADFRKLSFVLAALALVAVLTVPAQAQPAVSCTASPGQNVPLIRDGGLTELVGDVLLNCSPAVVGAAGTTNVNFQIFMNTTVSNRIKSSSALTVTASLTYTDSTGVEHVVVGVLQPTLPVDTPSLRNSILFPNVALPNGTVSTVRITNVRVVAPPANPAGALPAGVQEQISTSPAGTVPINNAFQTVAFVLTPVQFSVTACGSSTALTALNFVQCVNQPIGNKATFAVHFKEAFATAFKAKSRPNAGGVEDGDTLDAAIEAANPDHADTGTRLMLSFTNIPSGVTVLVSEYPVGTTAPTTAAAVMQIGAKSDGTAGEPATGTTADAICGGSATNAVMHEIESGGYAVWEVMSSTLDTDELIFAVQFKWTAQPGLGKPGLTGANPITVSGQLAPVSSVAQASTTAPIPRFANRPLAGGIQASISPCVTNLLFPWVTNVGNFDTSLVVSNTSADPFGTGTQSGKCTFYYFNGGPLGSGGLSTPPTTQPQPQTTTATVAAGAYVVSNMLFNGGLQGDANPIAPGSFSGYVIAVCNFQFAHGFAYITDRNAGSSTGSAGYTALIIPDWSLVNTDGSKARSASPSSAAGANTGEGLFQ